MAEKEKRAEYVYAKGANGMTARVPVDRLEQWKAAQDELRQQMRDGTYQPDKAKAAELLSALRAAAARARGQQQD